MDIADWRKKIDAIDQEVLHLLNERARAAQEIGRIKDSTKAPVYEPERERTIFANLHRSNSGPLTTADITQIFEQIIAIMRELQTRP